MLELTICSILGACIEIKKPVPFLTCAMFGQIETAKIAINEHPGYQVKSYKCRA